MEDLFKKWMKQEMKEPERPEMLPAAVAIYDNDSSEIPDRLKVSFKSGRNRKQHYWQRPGKATAAYVMSPINRQNKISLRFISRWQPWRTRQ